MSKLIISISLLLAVLLAGCGGAPAVPTVDPTEAVKSVAGDYTMQLTAEDLKNAGLTDPSQQINLGTWLISLGQDGNFTATRNGEFIADGNFGFTGTEMGVQLLHVCENCACEGNIGRYSWAVDEKQLVLKKIYDTCDGMAFVLTTKPLLRK
jgi:hypothetical protein